MICSAWVRTMLSFYGLRCETSRCYSTRRLVLVVTIEKSSRMASQLCRDIHQPRLWLSLTVIQQASCSSQRHCGLSWQLVQCEVVRQSCRYFAVLRGSKMQIPANGAGRQRNAPSLPSCVAIAQPRLIVQDLCNPSECSRFHMPPELTCSTTDGYALGLRQTPHGR